MDEAHGLQRLIDGKGWSQSQAAQVLGKSEAEISSTLRVLTLPADLLSTVLTSKDGAPSRYVLAELARLKPGAGRDRLLQAGKDGSLTVRMIRSARSQAPKLSTGRTVVRPGRRLTVDDIKRFSTSLRGMTEGAREISSDERACLQQLRAELDRLLRPSRKR